MTVFFPAVVDDDVVEAVLLQETHPCDFASYLGRDQIDGGFNQAANVRMMLPDVIVPVVRRGAERRPDGGLGQQLRLRVEVAVGIAAVCAVVRCTRGRWDDVVVEDTVGSPGVAGGWGGGREKGFGLYGGVVVQGVEFRTANAVADDAVLARQSLA